MHFRLCSNLWPFTQNCYYDILIAVYIYLLTFTFYALHTVSSLTCFALPVWAGRPRSCFFFFFHSLFYCSQESVTPWSSRRPRSVNIWTSVNILWVVNLKQANTNISVCFSLTRYHLNIHFWIAENCLPLLSKCAIQRQL